MNFFCLISKTVKQLEENIEVLLAVISHNTGMNDTLE